MTVTLNRREKLNAINPRMHEEVQELCRELRHDAGTRVVIYARALAVPSRPAPICEPNAPQQGHSYGGARTGRHGQ